MLRVAVEARGYIEVCVPDSVGENLLDMYEKGDLESLDEIPNVEWDDLVNQLTFDVDDIEPCVVRIEPSVVRTKK